MDLCTICGGYVVIHGDCIGCTPLAAFLRLLPAMSDAVEPVDPVREARVRAALAVIAVDGHGAARKVHEKTADTANDSLPVVSHARLSVDALATALTPTRPQAWFQ
jgi:hypothetical protein